jgi:uncharacterized protein (DUF362 family)
MSNIERPSPSEDSGKVNATSPASWRSRSWWALRLGGALALVWFLIRVIPKPSRASYPCQRAAFPVAAGFVVWLTGAFGAAGAIRKARTHLRQARWMMASVSVTVAAVAAAVVFVTGPAQEIFGQNSAPVQPTFTPSEPLNSPMGVAFGIKPGRVAWAFDPNATSWDGTTNSPGWWDDSNTHPQAVEKMLADAIRSVGDANTVKESWNKIFTNFNQRKGKGAVGYAKGEKIAIKLNLNQSRSHGDGGNASYISPQLTRALLAQLVNEVGVAPADITVYDASRFVPSTIFDRCTREFPGIHFVDSTGTDGREKAVPDLTQSITLSDSSETFYFPTCLTHAEYLINVAGLKGHTMAGMTVCAKNHLGSILTASGASDAHAMHPSIATKPGPRYPTVLQTAGSYNGLVDLNGSKQTGGKTVLYLIDGLYASKHNEYRLDPSCKWESAPFNHHWTSSIFAAQDGVAIDSVALDFLRSEPTLSRIVTGAVDNYLHEMALAGQPESKHVYDPDKTGKPLTSLGVHEHWNSAADKQYTRNLGSGTGIELVSLTPASASTVALK